jgi:hypothetical protein
VNAEGDPYFDPRNRMPNHHEISRYCSSLVVVVSTKSEDMLQLAHFSVKEYLTSNRVESVLGPHFQEVTASASIARVCLAYVLQFEHKIQAKEVLIKFPLAEYSARHWMTYAAVGNGEEDSLMGIIERFFCVSGAPYKVCYGIYRPDEPWKIAKMDAPAAPLYYAAVGGLQKTVQLLLAKNADVNAQGGVYGNALYAASDRGHEAVVKMLLDKGADVNAQGGVNGNALYAASDRGHEAVVKMLLDKGADVNAQGGFSGNALQVASDRGHEAVVKMLLDKVAADNALQAASSEGYKQVVKLLLEKNTHVNAQGGPYGNALCAASLQGHEQVGWLVGIHFTSS